ncbi:hypothetical protein [Ureibacillus aquaedulcis]|uniref:Lipoprotein n=1 Tax=Ureibacillus aquaedulcis TaxID=3058421 RepID=A0ABT8GNJ8_9BACL|nr:hypothetical protein [Ureibacillus sp. BA0131]MDN4492988.1 hypothetical protein [Ureibacillus sp. BA0131]
MRIKIMGLLIIVSIQSFLVGCSKNSIETEEYKGMDLKIGVIGEIPEVREKNIKFVELELKDIKEPHRLEELDAVFIMKENLIEAANDKYVESYQSGVLPFFFIESEKSYLPFVVAGASYEGTKDVQDGSYATGYLNDPKTKGEMKYWGYGLYNDIWNEENIKDAYSRIFDTISELNIVNNKL